MKPTVNRKVEPSECFEVDNGVKQSCFLPSTIFSNFLTQDLNIFSGYNNWITIHSRPGTDLFNTKQLRSRTKPEPIILIPELMFADDRAFMAHSHHDIGEIITCFIAIFPWNLDQQTEVLFQTAPVCFDDHLDIRISGEKLSSGKEFKFICATV